MASGSFGSSATFLAVLVMVVVALAAIGVLSPAPGTSAREGQSAKTGLSAYDYNATLGLVLELHVGPSYLTTGSGVLASVTVRNALATNNTLGLPRSIPLGMEYYQCGPAAPPLGIFFYVGYLGANNISTEASLPVTLEPSPPICPSEPSVDHFEFAPLSSNVTLYTRQGAGSQQQGAPRPFLRVNAHAALNVSGFWTGTDFLGINTGEFHQLTPGLYTVVGLDPWGQMVFLHFRVVNGWSPQSCIRQEGASVEPGCEAL